MSKSVRVGYRLPADVAASISNWAARLGVTQTQVIVTLVRRNEADQLLLRPPGSHAARTAVDRFVAGQQHALPVMPWED